MVNTLIQGDVVISNPVINCDNRARGTFTAAGAAATELGIAQGIVLSTGIAAELKADASSGSCCDVSTSLGVNAIDPELQNISGGRTDLKDRCVLEFDFVSQGSRIAIEYVFGSEEYYDYAPPTYTQNTYNDIFGFFISGADIPTVNFAKVPGTNQPVGVVNINPTNNPAFLKDNYKTKSCTENIATCNGSNTSAVEFNAYSTLLTATYTITPNNTYHIKLGVCDAGDGILDTGVFIKAGSFGIVLSDLMLRLIDDVLMWEASCMEAIIEDPDGNKYYEVQSGKMKINKEGVWKIHCAGQTKYAVYKKQSIENTDDIEVYELQSGKLLYSGINKSLDQLPKGLLIIRSGNVVKKVQNN